jgi:DNA-3-methyladenine glycosylase II
MKILTYTNDSEPILYLTLKDPMLKELFTHKKEIQVTLSTHYFEALIEAIISQQLSINVARIITLRLYELLEHSILPEKILSIPIERLKEIGLSKQKIAYIHSLSTFYQQNQNQFCQMDCLSNEEVISFLTKVKGIGQWTAEMFLMFSLGREDVFSVGDLGLRNALKKLYDNPHLTHEEILKISENWSPYRSIVAHYLWHAWDQ